MRGNYDDSVKEWWPMRNGNLTVKLEDHAGVVDQDSAKSINQMACHLGSYIVGHSKRKMKNVIPQRDGFYTNNIYYGDMVSANIHRKHCFTLVEKKVVGKSLGLGKNEYGNADIFYA